MTLVRMIVFMFVLLLAGYQYKRAALNENDIIVIIVAIIVLVFTLI